jgi:enoyl-CoA hydratase/carnithine racemase
MNISDFQDIIYEKEKNGICTLTFNRPERRNAISKLTFVEIEAVLDDMEQDKNAKVLIMTGCKEANAFSAGGYFGTFTSISPEIKKEMDFSDVTEKRLCMKLWDFSKPIIAAINGLAVGAGIAIPITGADLIYMSEDAWLAFVFIKRSILPEHALSFLLPFYIGFQKAKAFLYTGDRISAQEAERLGLVNKVLPPDELMPYTREQALRLIPPKGPSLSIKLMKKTMHDYFRDIILRTSELENEGDKPLMKTHDFRESTRAFIEKREPKFKGK